MPGSVGWRIAEAKTPSQASGSAQDIKEKAGEAFSSFLRNYLSWASHQTFLKVFLMAGADSLAFTNSLFSGSGALRASHPTQRGCFITFLVVVLIHPFELHLAM